MKMFEYCQHVAGWRVLVQTRDVADRAITGSKIAQRVIDWFHILVGAIRNEHLSDACVDSRALADNSVRSRHIAPGEVKAVNIGDGEVKSRHIGDGEVKTPDIANYAVTEKKLDPSLLNEIRSAAANGYALASTFGSNELIGVCQKTLTEAFDALWQKLEDITGEVYRGINMVVTPTYYIGEEGCTVTIAASTRTDDSETIGMFEWIRFYWNDDNEETEERSTAFLAKERTGGFTETVELPLERLVNDRIKIKCKAQIMGIEYMRQETIVHYPSAFLGAIADGGDYADIILPAYAISVGHGMRNAYDREVGDGEHIVVILGSALKSKFIRADINGIEIAFVEPAEPTVIGGNEYWVYVSENSFSAGNYNIDING